MLQAMTGSATSRLGLNVRGVEESRTVEDAQRRVSD